MLEVETFNYAVKCKSGFYIWETVCILALRALFEVHTLLCHNFIHLRKYKLFLNNWQNKKCYLSTFQNM